MTTGRLSGTDFEITSCTDVTGLSETPAGAKWKLKCNRNEDDSFTLPDDNTNASAGDRFVLLNITLPQAYVSASESRLLADGQAQLAKIDVSKVVYSVGFDEIYMKKNPTVSAQVMEGILCPVLDTQLGINTSIIAQTVTVDYGESQTPTYQVTLSNEPVAGTIGGIQDEIENVQGEVVVNKYKSDLLARRNIQNLNRLRDATFDTEGNYFTEKIAPLSIETKYLSVGAKSGDFLLNADIKPNYLGNFNTIFLSAGKLIHREIPWGDDPITEVDANYVWNIAGATVPNLVPLDQYYIYVKASKIEGTAVWLVTQAQLLADGLSDYYFLLGAIYPSLDAVGGIAHARGDSLEYGKTWIDGRFITTGRIQSASGDTYFDLDSSEIGGNIKFLSSGAYVDVGGAIDAINASEIGVVNIYSSNSYQGELKKTVPITVDSELIKCSENYYTSDNN